MKRYFYLFMALVNSIAGLATSVTGIYCTYIVVHTNDRRGWKVFVFFIALSFLFLHLSRVLRHLAKLEEGKGVNP